MHKLFLIIIFIITTLVSLPVPLFAEEIRVVIDGEDYTFDPAPELIEGRILVPMRAVFEVLGATVDWDQNSSTATGRLGQIEVKIPINSTTPTINGIEWTIDVPAQLINAHTFIPLRFVGEALGHEVNWDNNTVFINRIKYLTSPDPPV